MSSVVFAGSEVIQWVQDAGHVIVVDERRGEVHVLSGAEATVWGWLTLTYPYPKLIRLLAALLRLPLDEAEQRLVAILQNWRAAGLLETAGPSHG